MWWWRAKSATTGQVGDTNKISQVRWRETMQHATATFCRPVCGPLEALCSWRVRLPVRAQACVRRPRPASVNTAAIRTPTTARGVSVRTATADSSAHSSNLRQAVSRRRERERVYLLEKNTHGITKQWKYYEQAARKDTVHHAGHLWYITSYI